MTWIDDNLPLLLVLAPLLCALFIRLIPIADLSLVRQIAAFVLGICLLSIVRHGFLVDAKIPSVILKESLLVPGFENTVFSLSPTSLLLLLPIFFIGVATFIFELRQTEKMGISLTSTTLFLVSFTVAAILHQSILVKILLSHIALWFLFFGVAHLGGPQRGSAIMQTGIFFLVADIACFIAIFAFPTYQKDRIGGVLLTFLILLPAIARLLNVLVCPWMRRFFTNTPFELTMLFVLTITPVGAALFIDFLPILRESNTWETCKYALLGLSLFSLLFAALLASSEKSVKQYCIWYLSAFGSLFVVFSLLDPEGKDADFWAQSLIASACISVCIALAFARNIFADFDDPEVSDRFRFFWLASLSLLLAIPGLGVGTSFWGLFIARTRYAMSMGVQWSLATFTLLFCFVASFLLLSSALLDQLTKRPKSQKTTRVVAHSESRPFARVWFSLGAGVFLCLLPFLWRLQLG